jgi:hypothetical protein
MVLRGFCQKCCQKLIDFTAEHGSCWRMKTTSKKRGRKQRHHVASWGETIIGRSKRHDGRWRIIGTMKRFTEPDERRAVERFRQLTGGEDREAAQRIEQHAEADLKRWAKFFAEQFQIRPQWVATALGTNPGPAMNTWNEKNLNHKIESKGPGRAKLYSVRG